MAYIYASWKFFDDRIHDEEITLIYFFGDDYLDYQKKVLLLECHMSKAMSLSLQLWKDHPETDSAKL